MPTAAEGSGSTLVIHRVSPTEVIAFGRSEELDLLGAEKSGVDRPFVSAIRTAMAAAPQLQGAVDGLTGRVVRLTAEGSRLLRDNESMRTTVLTGVVRNPGTGKIAGHLTFVNPQSLAGLASTLPSIAGGAAMQLQLARIERALDGLKQDLGYLIRNEHLKIEASIETNLEILHDVYAVSRRRGIVEDDQWDRVANLEGSVRALHKETRKHLRSLDDALQDEGQRLATRVAKLNRALDDERTLYWLRAHVHAELALARWESLYLLRQAEQHPDELGELVGRLHGDVDQRHRALAALSQRIARYLSVGGTVSTLTDRLRLVRRARLKSLLSELDGLLRVFPPDLGSGEAGDREPIPLGDGTIERRQWDRLVSGAKSLPQAAAPVVKAIGAQMARVPLRRRAAGGSDE